MLLIVISIPLIVAGLGRLPLVGPDEPRYAEVAREMLASHDFISPRLCGCLWFEKPVLYYWMAAVSYAVFGVNEFAARLPSATSAIGSVLFLFYALKKRVSSKFAFLVCAVLITSPLFIGFARAAVTDMPLSAAFTVSLAALYVAATGDGRERTAFWLAACAAAGIAVLAKGLVGIVLFAVIGLICYAITRQPSLRLWELGLGALVFFLVCSAWYAPVIARHGWPFVQEFFINHHFKRYLTNEFHHPEPVYFYVFIVAVGVIPWTFYLMPAVSGTRSLARSVSPNNRYLLVLAWTWLIAPLVFFSLSESKLPGYILPALPAAAILIGWQLKCVWDGSQTLALGAANWLTALTALGIGIALPVYLHRQANGATVARWIQWVPLFLAAGGAAALVMRKRRLFASSVVVLMPVVMAAALVLVLPDIEHQVGLKALSIQATENLGPGEKIATFLDKQYAPVFYSKGRVMCGGAESDILNAQTTSELVEKLKTTPELVIITRSEWIPSLLKDERLEVKWIGTERAESAFQVSLRPPKSDR